MLPPLTGLEVVNYSEVDDRTLVYTMQLNINMQSMTIEQVLSMRQKQCRDLADVVRRDLSNHIRIGDIPRRQEEIAEQLSVIESEVDVNTFNGNAKFVEATKALVAQLPRVGEQLQSFPLHQAPIFALAVVEQQTSADGTVVISGSWDGTLGTIGENTRCFERMESPVLALTVLMGREEVAVGMQDRTVSLVSTRALKGSRREMAPVKLSGHSGPVCALAWLQHRGLLACGSDGVIVWQLNPYSSGNDCPEIRWRVGMADGVVRGMCWINPKVSSGHLWLASAPLDGQSTSLWDLERHESITLPAITLNEDFARSKVTAVISLDNALIVTGTTSGSITAWDVMASGTKLISKLGCHHLAVCTLAVVDKMKFASASADTTVKLWQLQQGQRQHPSEDVSSSFELNLVATLEGHSGPVHALAHFPERGWLASGGTDGSVQLWRSAIRHVDAIVKVSPSKKQFSTTVNATLSHSHSKSLCEFCGATNTDTTSVTCVSCGELVGPKLPYRAESINQCSGPRVAGQKVRPRLDIETNTHSLSRPNDSKCPYCFAFIVGSSVTCVECGELL